MSGERWLTKVAFAKAEGCDEKQVRRGVISGKLVARADGLLSSSQIGNGWRRPRVDSKAAPAPGVSDSKSDSTHAASDAVAGVPETVHGGGGTSLKDAVTRKEDFTGRLRELEYLQKAGELIDMATARRVLFDEFRAARDAWLNWPAKFAALIAADLNVEADRVAEVLTGYVHKQLGALGDPSGEFAQG